MAVHFMHAENPGFIFGLVLCSSIISVLTVHCCPADRLRLPPEATEPTAAATEPIAEARAREPTAPATGVAAPTAAARAARPPPPAPAAPAAQPARPPP